MPGRKNLLLPMMAIDKNGLWVHQKFGYSIPRRNGKSEILYILEIWGLHKGIEYPAYGSQDFYISFLFRKGQTDALRKWGMWIGEDFIRFVRRGRSGLNLFNRWCYPIPY